jgi:hypothetical protein
MVTHLSKMSEPPAMRVTSLWPPTDWASVWHKLHETPVPEDTKLEWYRAIHDRVPTQERLHRINMAATNLCKNCHAVDNLRHRLIECEEGQRMWNWTRERVATILQTDVRSIQDSWMLRPALSIRPPKGRRAVLWTLANFVVCRLQQLHKLTQHDYYGFLKRAEWKLQHGKRWQKSVGTYMSDIAEDFPTPS